MLRGRRDGGWQAGLTGPGAARLPFPAEVALAALAGLVAFLLVALAGHAARHHVPGIVLGLALLAAVLVIARTAGILHALPVGVVSILAYDWFFLPPLRELNDTTVTVLALFLSMSVIVGAMTTLAARRAVAAERARGDLAETQASLRRLALLIARGEAPERVFAAVTKEVLRHFGSGTARLVRQERDGSTTLLASAGQAGSDGRSVRMPIHVDGRPWGRFEVCSSSDELPADTEARMTEFTELVATAVAESQSRAELISSRARIVAAADEARRRIERDLHDGAQQRLVALALRLRTLAMDAGDSSGEVAEVAADLLVVIDELRELSRGIHPAVLTDSGLRPALRALGRRSPLPVEVTVRIDGRLPQPVEVGAYYVVSEMLANAAKHAGASVVEVEAEAADGALRLRVRDDGSGGADPARGSGLVGLKDRIEALGGTFAVHSPPGEGTTVTCRIPLDRPVTP